MSVSARAVADEEAVVAAPVTVPYQRYSTRTGHTFVARAVSALLKASGLSKRDIDGLSVGSFTLTPDTAVGLLQHLGMTTRWLDFLPIGGMAGIVALRRALRAVQAGDAEVVACIGAEDVYPGDVAQEWLERWRENPKVLERELAQSCRL